jgi:hypothetical protein
MRVESTHLNPARGAEPAPGEAARATSSPDPSARTRATVERPPT